MTHLLKRLSSSLQSEIARCINVFALTAANSMASRQGYDVLSSTTAAMMHHCRPATFAAREDLVVSIAIETTDIPGPYTELLFLLASVATDLL
jgi:hypothetical protein